MGGLSSKQQFQLVLTKLASVDVDHDAHEFWDEVRVLACGQAFKIEILSYLF